MDDAGELVFVSYSHVDAAWAQRFEVLLEPLLPTRGPRLWVDRAALRAGEEWHPAIEAAIDRSTAALLLVSADFLASGFVMRRELPALLERGIPLLPVLVGDCLWDAVPQLAGRQWLHDIGDGPLRRDGDDPRRQDGRLVAICRTLIATLSPAPAEPTAGFAGRPAPVDAVPLGPAEGALSEVPAEPPGYVVRDELAALIDAVTATDTGGAVAVTAETDPLGLCGQGGVGKSVLAAALGRDPGIRHRFPDGVLWVTVGDRSDVLGLQLDLLARVGGTGPPPRSVGDATVALREVLRGRRVLLLVDDVWSDAAALAFRVTGPRGRVVYTSRDRRVVAAVGAHAHTVGALSVETARAVAAAVLGTRPEHLPPTADDAFAAVGRVALAVALLAAATRAGRSWDGLAAALGGEVDVYGDHPYANTFKAMQIAVDELPDELAAALLGLAVFPPDTTVPVAAVARYWAHTRGDHVDTTADLERLAAANLLRHDGDGIGFHDLQHDYLLLHSAAAPLLHAALLDAYRALLPHDARDEWWRLPPDEPYIWGHLVAHLARAGKRHAVAETAIEPAYLVRRLDGGGLHAAETDLARAGELWPEHPLVDWWRRWLARHAAFLAAREPDGAGSVGPTVLAWLAADPTRPAEVDPRRLTPVLPSPYLAVRWGLSSPEPTLVRQLTGHRAAVRTVDWSPDGTRIAGGADDGEVRLWNPETGQTVAVIDTGRRAVATVAWSPDGRQLVTAGRYGLRVYDAHGHLIGPPLDKAITTDVIWSPCGRWLLVVTGFGDLWVRDPLGEEPDEFLDAGRGTEHVAWGVDELLATAAEDGEVEVWNTGARRRFPTPMLALSWAPRSPTLAVVGGGRVHLWRTSDDSVVTVGVRADRTRAAAWSNTGDRLATGGADVVVAELDGVRSVRLGGHTDLVTSVAWSPDGTRLATAGGDREVQIWDTAVGLDAASHPASWIDAVAVSRDGGLVATLGGDRRALTRPVLQVWDVARDGEVAATLPANPFDKALACEADGRVVAVVGAGLARWEHASGRRTTVERWRGDAGHHMVRGTSVVSADGRMLAVARSGQVQIWDDDARDAVAEFRYAGEVTTLSWSADGARLAGWRAAVTDVERDESEVVVWEPGSDWACATLRLDGCRDGLLGWSPDASRLAVARAGAPLLLWEPASGATATLPSRVDSPTGVAWSPDGRHIVATGEDGAVVLHPVDGSPVTHLQLAGANCVDWAGPTLAVGTRTGPVVLQLRE